MNLLTLITVIHLTIALLLIFFVLLQDSKGGAMGVFGGGGDSNTLFGTGATSFLVKVTRWTAIAFAGTCIGLAYLSTNSGGSSVIDEFVPAAASDESLTPSTDAPKADEVPKPDDEEPQEADETSKSGERPQTDEVSKSGENPKAQ